MFATHRPVYGGGCIDADGNDVPGAEGGDVVATSNPQHQSFKSAGGELRLETE